MLILAILDELMYGSFFETVSIIASWVSKFLIYSLQNEATTLVWIALYVAIANSRLIYLKSWMAKKNGEAHDNIGPVLVGWTSIWVVIHTLAKVAGIGLIVYGIVTKLS